MTSLTMANDLSDEARELRRLVIEMTSQKEGAHVGGSLSIVDVLCVLFNRILRFDPLNPDHPERDFFILSKGHCAAALYAVLARGGFIPARELSTYATNGSRLTGHPSAIIPGIEFPTGSLGHGLSLGVGVALGLQRARRGNRTFVVMGDGELQEGSVWEAASSAMRFGLGHLIAIVDQNALQINGPVDPWLPANASYDKWRSFGWHVSICNGHLFDEIETTIVNCLRDAEAPHIIFAKTVKGKGLPSLENNKASHYAAFTPHDRLRMLEEFEAGHR